MSSEESQSQYMYLTGKPSYYNIRI
jgi:hypothetical protein